MVPFIDLSRLYERLRSEVDEAVKACFGHQRWILGPELEKFESAFADALGAKHAIGVASGTDALVLGLRAIAIARYGEEFFSRDKLVITTPFTFSATAEAIIRAGATPLFVDVDYETMNLSVEAVRRAVREYRDRVVGMVVVHLYGYPADVGGVTGIAEEDGLFLVEDCAQAFGSRVGDKMVGTFGDVGAFSFFPTKNLPGIGDGGMVVTNDDELREVVSALRNHGGKDKYALDYLGYNSRLDTIQSAVLLVHLRHFDVIARERARIADYYFDRLSSLKGLALPPHPDGIIDPVYNLFTVRVSPGRREELSGYLAKQGIGVGIYYPKLVSEMPPMSARSVSTRLSNARRLTEEVLSLPCFPFLTAQEQDEVVQAISGFLR